MWLRLMAAVSCLALLTGCGGRNGAQEGLELWFAVDQGQAASAAALDTQPYQGEQTVPGLMQGLLHGPAPDSGLKRAIPEGTQLLDWQVENGVAHLDLSQPYGDLVGMDLTLANYSITLTLTQLEGIEGVRLSVNAASPQGWDSQVLRPSDVVFSGVEEEPVELSAVLYFRREGTQELGYELRVFQLTEKDDPATTVLQALLAGPQDSGLTAVLPEGVEVRSIQTDNGICTVDFSAGLLEHAPGAQEEQVLVLESIVNTLCSLDSVGGVQLQVEGAVLTQYGQLALEQPLTPRE